MHPTNGAPSAPTTPNAHTLNGNGLERERVLEIQRTRLLAAMTEVAAERGVANVTVAQVVERAGVSRRTFYELFSDCQECFLAALDRALEQIANRVAPLYRQPGRWHDRVRSALIEALSIFDEHPPTGSLVIVEALGAGRPALERRGQLLARAIAAVEDGRGESKSGAELSRLTAEGVVGAVLSVIHGRLLEADRAPLIELTNPLMSMIVLPYLGAAAARRESTRPVSATARPSRNGGASNPLKDLHIRLTYRTVRVLLALAASPGGSNRVLGDAAGIADQGQISKLLARLEKIGLVANDGAGSPRGAPNAWTLTQRGEEVRDALAAQATPG
jgi:AcrR family transcriptional regulator